MMKLHTVSNLFFGSVVGAALLSGCGTSSSDSGVPTSLDTGSGNLYSQDEALTAAFSTTNFMADFNKSAFVDATGSKTDTTETMSFPCDSGTADVDVTYLSTISSSLKLKNINDCQVGSVTLDNNTITASISIENGVHSLELSLLTDTFGGHVNYNDADGSYDTVVRSSMTELSPEVKITIVDATISGSVDSNFDHNVTDASLVRSYSDGYTIVTEYNYLFTNQLGQTIYLDDSLTGDTLTYTIQ